MLTPRRQYLEIRDEGAECAPDLDRLGEQANPRIDVGELAPDLMLDILAWLCGRCGGAA